MIPVSDSPHAILLAVAAYAAMGIVTGTALWGMADPARRSMRRIIGGGALWPAVVTVVLLILLAATMIAMFETDGGARSGPARVGRRKGC